MLENLVVAVESEAQVIDIARVSGFMQKVRDLTLRHMTRSSSYSLGPQRHDLGIFGYSCYDNSATILCVYIVRYRVIVSIHNFTSWNCDQQSEQLIMR